MAGRFAALVLEPSPPAVKKPPWFADDPMDPGDPRGRKVVSPITNADVTWDELCRSEPELRPWCAERWLGAWARLESLPANFGKTRASLHSLAEHVIAAARHHANGKIGLRYTRRGFGTPFFDDDVQVRVEGTELVVQRNGREERSGIRSIGDAARAVGITPGAPRDVYEPETEMDVTGDLAIEEEAALSLGAWFGFGASVLEQLRWDYRSRDPSLVQLWPEHFDIAIELGDEGTGARAAYGASPGDENHPAPYLYIAPWSTPPTGPLWDEEHFDGASLGYEELLGASDQRAAALDFLHRGLKELHALGS